MFSLILEALFQWIVSNIWDRHGPLVGIVSAIVILAMLIGCIFGAISLWNFAVS